MKFTKVPAIIDARELRFSPLSNHTQGGMFMLSKYQAIFAI